MGGLPWWRTELKDWSIVTTSYRLKLDITPPDNLSSQSSTFQHCLHWQMHRPQTLHEDNCSLKDNKTPLSVCPEIHSCHINPRRVQLWIRLQGRWWLFPDSWRRMGLVYERVQMARAVCLVSTEGLFEFPQTAGWFLLPRPQTNGRDTYTTGQEGDQV